jgi:hypothetical protein
LLSWLRRASTLNAHLRAAIVIYRPLRRGELATADEYRTRAIDGDQTILSDALVSAIEGLREVQSQIETAMEPAPVADGPGTAAKVRAMALRVARRESVFAEMDSIDGAIAADGSADRDGFQIAATVATDCRGADGGANNALATP